MRRVLLTGGIGSGKSVVASILQVMGYRVYDTDAAAKRIMTDDLVVMKQLIDAFGIETFAADGAINKSHLGSLVFTDDAKRLQLNDIVHPAVKADLRCWSVKQEQDGQAIVFAESALPRTSGLNQKADDVWHVTAPDELRISRVVKRNGMSRQQVLNRIAAQRDELAVMPGEYQIVNDEESALIPQISALIQKIINK